MAILPIRVYPDPVLRVRCQPVETFDAELEQLVDDMIDTMRAAPGVGLAASQVGVEKRLTVIDVSSDEEESDLHVLVNPVLLEDSGRTLDIEGCLSLPEITEKVDRPDSVKVRAQDLKGKTFELEGVGLLARVICHEIDHLDGILFVDHLTGLRRDRIRRRLKRLAKEQEVAV